VRDVIGLEHGTFVDHDGALVVLIGNDNDRNAVRGRSTSSDVSSDISPSPLYIPPHRRQPKTECTRGSDTGVR